MSKYVRVSTRMSDDVRVFELSLWLSVVLFRVPDNVSLR